VDPTAKDSIAAVERLLQPFLDEALPEGGIDAARSPWQLPGRGSASGSDVFPGRVDVRYLRFLVEVLYRAADAVRRPAWAQVADSHARYLARAIRPDHPTWAIGNALEAIGLYARRHPVDAELRRSAEGLVTGARARRVRVTTRRGVVFDHFPCGYGVAGARDAGWTNDLSMLGSGLVWGFEVLRDGRLLSEAASFAEYFVQPWEADALDERGYWACGTWSEALGSWVIGPSHYSGFESTEAHADEASWVFSTLTCIDYLTRLHAYHPDPRFLCCCARAAAWTFEACQFPDGAVGMCGRDDKWLGCTGDAITQVALLAPLLADSPERLAPLRAGAARAWGYLSSRLPRAPVAEHGVEWVRRTTSTDPLVNVAMLWASALLGWQHAVELGL
jgi:hypothetical protein